MRTRSPMQDLITQGHVILDKKNEWGDHHPTAQQDNDFIHDHGFAEYSKWRLGIDATHAQSSKARFKFPFGDFKNIHRCALLAVKSRAHQYGYSDIENAAERLLEMMEGRGGENRRRILVWAGTIGSLLVAVRDSLKRQDVHRPRRARKSAFHSSRNPTRSKTRRSISVARCCSHLQELQRLEF